jgi:hypothetical protein
MWSYATAAVVGVALEMLLDVVVRVVEGSQRARSLRALVNWKACRLVAAQLAAAALVSVIAFALASGLLGKQRLENLKSSLGDSDLSRFLVLVVTIMVASKILEAIPLPTNGTAIGSKLRIPVGEAVTIGQLRQSFFRDRTADWFKTSKDHYKLSYAGAFLADLSRGSYIALTDWYVEFLVREILSCASRRDSYAIKSVAEKLERSYSNAAGDHLEIEGALRSTANSLYDLDCLQPLRLVANERRKVEKRNRRLSAI